MQQHFFTALFIGLIGAGPAAAQQFEPPPAVKIDQAMSLRIAARTEKLATHLNTLRRQGVGEPGLADVEIYHKAAIWIVRHGEFFTPETARVDARRARPRPAPRQPAGPGRGAVAASERPGNRPRLSLAASTARCSRTPSPCRPTMARTRGRMAARRRAARPRFDAHRGEVPPAAQRRPGDAQGPGLRPHRHLRPGQQRLPLGRREPTSSRRSTTSWRSNGCSAASLIEPTRIVLRGFSMGGAGTWHLGLHRPDHWCVHRPRRRLHHHARLHQGPARKLPDYQEKCLNIYDAVDYAENAFNVPIVAYGGEQDAAESRRRQHRGAPEEARPADDAHRRPGPGPLVSAGMAEEGRRRVRQVRRPRAARSIPTRSASSPTRCKYSDLLPGST